MNPDISKIWPGWEIVEPIGRGSFGSVYKIQRSIRGSMEVAALKVITIPQNRDEIHQLRSDGYDDRSITQYFLDSLEKIENEYALMANLKGHSNIVYCDDINAEAHEDGFGWNIYIRMELLTPMKKWLGGTVTEAQVIKLGMDICSALSLCHQLSIVHRDLKPDNIFVSRDGNFKLGDFGIAKTMEGTRMGTLTGTYDYMAPEVYCGKPYFVQADIYSLGIVLYWMLNDFTTPFLPTGGTKPTPTVKRTACERRFSGETIPDPIHGSKALKAIVRKACEFDPKNRFQTPGEMFDALSALQRGTPVSAGSLTGTQQPAADSDEDDRTILTKKKPVPQTGKNTPERKKPEVKPKDAPGSQSSPGSGKSPETRKSPETGGGSKKPEKGKKKPKGRRSKPPLLLLVLLLVVALSAGAVFLFLLMNPQEQVTAKPGDDYYALTAVGQIEDPEKVLSISNGVVTRRESDGREDVVWYTPAGTAFRDNTFIRVDLVGGGLYAGKTNSENINSVALLNSDGEELLPPEACLIRWPATAEEGESRYVYVYYALEKSTSKDDYLICVKDGYIYTSNISDELYTGEIKIYDLQEKQFVPNLPTITNANSVNICGDSILLRQEDGTHMLYNSGGMPVLNVGRVQNVAGSSMVCSKDSTYYVYDGNGVQTYVSNKSLFLMDDGEHLQMSDGDGKVLLDCYGNVLFHAEYIYSAQNDRFVIDVDGKKGLVTEDGIEVLPARYGSISDLGNGFSCAAYGNQYTLIGEDGIIATNLEKMPYDLKIQKDESLYILNSRTYSLDAVTYAQPLTSAMISMASQTNGLYGVFDLFSGEQLLPYQYENIRYAADHVYAYRGGIWEIYEVTLHR